MQCHPQPDLLSGLAQLSRNERTFKAGDLVMRQGDTGKTRRLESG